MRIPKAVAKALAFEQACLKLGFKPEQIKFQALKQDKLIENRRLVVELNGLIIDCFGFWNESDIDMTPFRNHFEQLSPEGKEYFLKENSEFIVHHGSSINLFHTKQLGEVLKLNKHYVPSLAN